MTSVGSLLKRKKAFFLETTIEIRDSRKADGYQFRG